eukprot:TRINITY_DN8768_c0_g1_i1.p1 TRINITY_DN8768_c0_g1~~TRINITY_DN8768_c0_g1_i1.p1  ORF type:complete len:1363 (+),score=328.27 TRINITY_DN8768_c0_g1_i1:86-4090(+)
MPARSKSIAGTAGSPAGSPEDSTRKKSLAEKLVETRIQEQLEKLDTDGQVILGPVREGSGPACSPPESPTSPTAPTSPKDSARGRRHDQHDPAVHGVPDAYSVQALVAVCDPGAAEVENSLLDLIQEFNRIMTRRYLLRDYLTTNAICQGHPDRILDIVRPYLLHVVKSRGFFLVRMRRFCKACNTLRRFLGKYAAHKRSCIRSVLQYWEREEEEFSARVRQRVADAQFRGLFAEARKATEEYHDSTVPEEMKVRTVKCIYTRMLLAHRTRLSEWQRGHAECAVRVKATRLAIMHMRKNMWGTAEEDAALEKEKHRLEQELHAQKVLERVKPPFRFAPGQPGLRYKDLLAQAKSERMVIAATERTAAAAASGAEEEGDEHGVTQLVSRWVQAPARQSISPLSGRMSISNSPAAADGSSPAVHRSRSVFSGSPSGGRRSVFNISPTIGAAGTRPSVMLSPGTAGAPRRGSSRLFQRGSVFARGASALRGPTPVEEPQTYTLKRRKERGPIGLAYRGTTITEVFAKSAAAEAGLQEGMRILKVSGREVQDDTADVAAAFADAPQTFEVVTLPLARRELVPQLGSRASHANTWLDGAPGSPAVPPERAEARAEGPPARRSVAPQKRPRPAAQRAVSQVAPRKRPMLSFAVGAPAKDQDAARAAAGALTSPLSDDSSDIAREESDSDEGSSPGRELPRGPSGSSAAPGRRHSALRRPSSARTGPRGGRVSFRTVKFGDTPSECALAESMRDLPPLGPCFGSMSAADVGPCSAVVVVFAAVAALGHRGAMRRARRRSSVGAGVESGWKERTRSRSYRRSLINAPQSLHVVHSQGDDAVWDGEWLSPHKIKKAIFPSNMRWPGMAPELPEGTGLGELCPVRPAGEQAGDPGSPSAKAPRGGRRSWASAVRAITAAAAATAAVTCTVPPVTPDAERRWSDPLVQAPLRRAVLLEPTPTPLIGSAVSCPLKSPLAPSIPGARSDEVCSHARSRAGSSVVASRRSSSTVQRRRSASGGRPRERSVSVADLLAYAQGILEDELPSVDPFCALHDPTQTGVISPIAAAEGPTDSPKECPGVRVKIGVGIISGLPKGKDPGSASSSLSSFTAALKSRTQRGPGSPGRKAGGRRIGPGAASRAGAKSPRRASEGGRHGHLAFSSMHTDAADLTPGQRAAVSQLRELAQHYALMKAADVSAAGTKLTPTAKSCPSSALTKRGRVHAARQALARLIDPESHPSPRRAVHLLATQRRAPQHSPRLRDAGAAAAPLRPPPRVSPNAAQAAEAAEAAEEQRPRLLTDSDLSRLSCAPRLERPRSGPPAASFVSWAARQRFDRLVCRPATAAP